jgi:NADH pyrophosphatase NudC (nudix superfamily)
MAKPASACPASDCKAASPPQEEASAQLSAAGATGDWIRNARRCSYCGSVYVSDAGGTQIIKGYLDNDVLGRGWKPIAG